MSLRLHAAELAEVVTAAGVTVYDTLAPDAATGRYAVLYPGRRFITGAVRNSAADRAVGYRVAILSVGQTPNEARWVEEKVTAALDQQRVTIDGTVCTPAAFESSRPVEPDPDDPAVFSGTTVWTYVAAPAADLT